jgi:hypothetical protein
MKCKAFSDKKIGTYNVMVDEDGTIRVYDSVAGYYTTCHSLSRNATRRALKAASAR